MFVNTGSIITNIDNVAFRHSQRLACVDSETTQGWGNESCWDCIRNYQHRLRSALPITIGSPRLRSAGEAEQGSETLRFPTGDFGMATTVPNEASSATRAGSRGLTTILVVDDQAG